MSRSVIPIQWNCPPIKPRWEKGTHDWPLVNPKGKEKDQLTCNVKQHKHIVTKLATVGEPHTEAALPHRAASTIQQWSMGV